MFLNLSCISKGDLGELLEQGTQGRLMGSYWK